MHLQLYGSRRDVMGAFSKGLLWRWPIGLRALHEPVWYSGLVRVVMSSWGNDV